VKYELAKELQELLPFCPSDVEPTDFLDGTFLPRNHNNKPIGLSELIEACGDVTLDKKRDAPCEGEEVDTFTYDAYTDKMSFISDTPEEAVARLWLALNKP